MFIIKVLFIWLSVTIIVHCGVTDNEIDRNSACNLPASLKTEIAGYQSVANDIIQEFVAGSYKGKTWEWLADLVDTFGARYTGSATLEQSIDYMVRLSKKMKLDVHTEEVEVPYWIRGNESAWLKTPREVNLPMLGLGGSVGTPPEGITASVVVVNNFDELKRLPDDQILGKIVVFNPTFVTYGLTVQYRSKGASYASMRGAVAALVRSVTPKSMRTPHTGFQSYVNNVVPIPVACITIEDSEMLHRMYTKGENITIHLKMDAKNLNPTTSRNTIMELPGHDLTVARPIVIVSGHIDSWDVGDGAMDDGGGAMISFAAATYLRQKGLRPRRTIRAILWTAEEVGLVGAEAYFKAHQHELETYNFVMESDAGTFKPLGLDFSGSENAGCIVQEVLKLLEPINATQFATPQDGGPDISLVTQKGIPGSSLLNQDGRYFWYHHSAGDSMAVEDPHNLDLCAAVWTVVSYVIADLRDDLPRT